MEWYVIVEDVNKREISTYNIFNHYRFAEGVKEAYEAHKNDYAAFCGQVNRELMYYFWSKCEWEVIVSEWPPSPREVSEKIDAYSQVMMNQYIFFEYVWNECKKIYG